MFTRENGSGVCAVGHFDGEDGGGCVHGWDHSGPHGCVGGKVRNIDRGFRGVPLDGDREGEPCQDARVYPPGKRVSREEVDLGQKGTQHDGQMFSRNSRRLGKALADSTVRISAQRERHSLHQHPRRPAPLRPRVCHPHTLRSIAHLAHNRRTRQRPNPKQAVHRRGGGGRGSPACHICRQCLGHKRRVLHLLQPQFYPLSDRCETSGSMEVVWNVGRRLWERTKRKEHRGGNMLVERNMVGGNGTMLVEHLLCKTGGGGVRVLRSLRSGHGGT